MRYVLEREAEVMTDNPEHVRRMNLWLMAGVAVAVIAAVATLLWALWEFAKLLA
jgi:type VI protein secretion system component VasK